MLRMTACKKKQDSDDIILRFVSYSENEQYLNIKKSKFIDNLYKSNIVEIKGEHIEEQNDGWRILIKPYEIVTLGVMKNRRNIL
jgi:alpha-mannosidase